MHFGIHYFKYIYIYIICIYKYIYKKLVYILLCSAFYFIEKPSYFSSFSEVSLYWYTGNSHLLPQIGKVTDLKRKVCKGEMHRS